MKSISYYIIACLSVLFCCALCSCENNEDATPISVWYDDAVMPAEANSGDQLHFKAKLYTDGIEKIKSYEVVFDNHRSPVTLKSETLNGAAEYLIDFYTDVPYVLQDVVKCKISTRVYGVNGFQNTISRELTVHGALKEYSGFKLYSSDSGKENGFMLADLNIIYKKSDMETLDVYFVKEDGKESWRTSSEEIDFVRANNFNFAKATINSLSQTYENSTKVKVVEDIKAEDIIIIGKNKKAWGAFLCLAYDSESKGYIFSYKLIPQE